MRPVLCMGEALIDFQPAAAGEADGLFRRYAGGAPANVAVAVARLGGRAEFLGMLGEDAFGDFLLEELRAAGVGTAGVQRTADAPTALAFVNLDARGERSFSFYRDRAADLLFRADAIPPRVFEDAAILHACSNSLVGADIAEATFACMRRAREAGALVGFDMNLRPALWAPGVDPAPRLWRALALADVVKLCVGEFDFAAGPSGDHEAMIARLWRGATRLLVVTDGDRMLRWFAPDGRGELHPFAVRAVDTTAAGDAFAGGLLFALARRGVDASTLPALVADPAALASVLRFAAACGALAATRPGAFAAMPAHDDVARLLATGATTACAASAPAAGDRARPGANG